MKLHFLVAIVAALASSSLGFQTERPFRITVVDSETGRGIPLVELTMTNSATFITDNAGVVAFDEPGLLDTRVFFTVKSHGYSYPRDAFGIEGVALDISPGGSATIEMDRVNLAERLYRVTGEGLYRDSVMLGDSPPIEHPLTNGLVMGQDSVQSVVYDNTVHWFWGDTGRVAYALGNFHASGAVSNLPTNGGLDPSVGVNLEYFVDKNGFSRPMIPMDGPGPVWLDGLMTIPDENGRERLLCHWVRVKSLGEIYERGMAMYNDERKIFERIATLPNDANRHAMGHPIDVRIDGQRYYLFGAPFPFLRVRATMDDVVDPDAFESLTPLAPTSTSSGNSFTIDRDSAGRPIVAWKRSADPMLYQDRLKLVQQGKLEDTECWINLRDVETGETVIPHGGSISWNDYRKRWVAIVLQTFGEPSFLGEIWYAEADTPLGPWTWAQRIVTHDQYSFYNPKHHPFFDQDSGRVIYFEGTYTASFSAAKTNTPRYDYNQIMYRLALDSPRLKQPEPVYETPGSGSTFDYISSDSAIANHRHGDNACIPFYAASADGRSAPGESTLVPVYGSNDAKGTLLSTSSSNPDSKPMFRAWPAEGEGDSIPAAALVPLYEFENLQTGARRYATPDDLDESRWSRVSDRPICRVWPNPVGRHTTQVVLREGARVNHENE